MDEAKAIPVIVALNENHDASVAVWSQRDGLTALATERVTQVKHDITGIIRTIDYIFDALNFDRDQVSLVVRCCDPVAISNSELEERNSLLRARFPDADSIMSSTHHELHALAARQLSPGDDGAILVVDGMGSRMTQESCGEVGQDNYECASIFSAYPFKRVFSRGTTHNPYDWNHENIGLGRLYSYVSKHIFGSRYDAGKTMALAPFGNPILTESFLSFTQNPRVPYVRGRNMRYLKPQPNDVNDYMSEADLAARAQADIEEGMMALSTLAAQLVPAKTLYLSGGVALNCPSNSKIRSSGLFQKTLVHPAATDDGISLGGIVLGARERGIDQLLPPFTDPFLGPPIRAQRERLMKESSRLRCRITELPDDKVARLAAHLLNAGKIIALYDGRSEFGPRALGHRSIIASPTSLALRDFINRNVKGREPFRPLAPAILQDRVMDFFEVGPNFENPYMLLTAHAKKTTVQMCPGVIHVDGTARVQTVPREGSPRLLSAILESIEALGKPPMVLNTSLNGKNEPIVETPEEAFRLFINSPIDALCSERLLIEKRKA